MIEIRAPRPDEFENWYALYEPYSHIVESPVTPQIGRAVWDWLQDASNPVEARVALRDGAMTGFVHFRPFHRTLDANLAGFLDDIYVADVERGSGLARTLIERIVAIARERGWSHVRWVTTDENRRARGLYEKLALQMDLLTYRIDIE